jgi:hypothetical protein
VTFWIIGVSCAVCQNIFDRLKSLKLPRNQLIIFQMGRD